MLLVITIYGLALFLSGFALYPGEINLQTSLEYGYIQKYYISIFPIYFFYWLSLKGILSEENVKPVFFVFLFFSILAYYQNYYLMSNELDTEEITNNMGYIFVPLIPMLALIKMNDIWKYILLIFVFAIIMMSMKRGAILVATIALLLYLKHHLNTKSTKQYIYIIILSVVAVCAIYVFVMNLYETSDYFKARFINTTEGDTSNRTFIYTHFYDFYIYQTSSLEFLWGCGANTTYLKLGEYAHNDWLEFAINQGLISGVIPYLVYWIFFIWEWKHFEQGLITYKQVLGDLIIFLFVRSLFSMSIDGMPTIATLCIGYCLAQNEKAKRTQLINELRNRVFI